MAITKNNNDNSKSSINPAKQCMVALGKAKKPDHVLVLANVSEWAKTSRWTSDSIGGMVMVASKEMFVYVPASFVKIEFEDQDIYEQSVVFRDRNGYLLAYVELDKKYCDWHYDNVIGATASVFLSDAMSKKNELRVTEPRIPQTFIADELWNSRRLDALNNLVLQHTAGINAISTDLAKCVEYQQSLITKQRARA